MIGSVPDGWRNEKLGEAFIVKDGTHDSPKYVIDDNSYPLLTSKNIKSGKLFLDDCNYISKDDYDKINQRSKVHKNDIIMPMIGTIGNPLLILEEPNFAIKNVALFKPKNENPKFLLHYLKSNIIKKRFEMDSKGGTQKFVSLTYLRNLPIPIPSLPQQEKIVKVLDISSQLIEKQKELIHKYDLFLKSKFIEMFGDPISNPMGWEIKKLKEISTLISSGSTPKGGSQVYVQEGILFFRSQNVWRNRILLDDIAYIDNETHLKMKKSSLKHKDILITKTGRFNTENSSLGRASLFLGEDNSANVNGHVYLVRLKKSMIHEFVVYILTTDEYREYIRRVCVGGIDKRQINKAHLEKFPIIFPAIELQAQFASIVKKTEQIKQQEIQKLEHLETLYNSLMDKAFKGEVS